MLTPLSFESRLDCWLWVNVLNLVIASLVYSMVDLPPVRTPFESFITVRSVGPFFAAALFAARRAPSETDLPPGAVFPSAAGLSRPAAFSPGATFPSGAGFPAGDFSPAAGLSPAGDFSPAAFSLGAAFSPATGLPSVAGLSAAAGPVPRRRLLSRDRRRLTAGRGLLLIVFLHETPPRELAPIICFHPADGKSHRFVL